MMILCVNSEVQRTENCEIGRFYFINCQSYELVLSCQSYLGSVYIINKNTVNEAVNKSKQASGETLCWDLYSTA